MDVAPQPCRRQRAPVPWVKPHLGRREELYLGLGSEERVAHVAHFLVGVLIFSHAVDVDVRVVLKWDTKCP